MLRLPPCSRTAFSSFLPLRISGNPFRQRILPYISIAFPHASPYTACNSNSTPMLRAGGFAGNSVLPADSGQQTSGNAHSPAASCPPEVFMIRVRLIERCGFGLLLSALLLHGSLADPRAQDMVGNGELTVSSGSWNYVYGLRGQPRTGDALAEGARLVISGGSVSSSLYGGYARSDNGTARAGSNAVTISGGLSGDSPGLYGGYARSRESAVAAGNSLSLHGPLSLGSWASAYGGYARADGGDAGLFMTTNNRVFLDGTAHLFQIFGGRVSAGSAQAATAAAYGNMVDVAGGSVDELYGGSAASKGTAVASGNTVSIAGGTVTDVIGGEAFSSGGEAEADGNIISITGGNHGTVIGASVQSDVTQATAADNAIYLSNATVSNVTGAYSPNAATPSLLEGNTVVVGGGARVTGTVHGSDARDTNGSSSASYNTIAVVEGGRVDGDLVGGALAGAGSASHNTILVNDGSLGGNIYGGQTGAGGSATGNSIIIGRQATLPASIQLFGGYVGGQAVAARGSGNTLFVDSWQGTVDRAAGFANLHFVLPAPGTAAAGVPMLTISNAEANDFDGTTVTAQLPDIIAGGRAHLGETFELVHDDSQAIAKADASSLVSLLQGYAILYDGAIFRNDDSVYIRIDGYRSNPLAGALTEARIGAAGLLNQGGDLLAGAAVREARAAARRTDARGWAAFATLYGGAASLTTDTDVTARGMSLVTGLARHGETAWLDVLVGAFFEMGYGNLSTAREAAGETIKGAGDAHYTGGGLLARIDLAQGLLRGLYVEASGRAGQVDTSWNSDDLMDNMDRPADYDLATPYYGGHAGLGWLLPLNEDWTLDVYGKYLFTHQDGQETSINGDIFHFDAVDSSRVRLGARLEGNILPAASVYMGAGWEYESLGTARAASLSSDMAIPSTSMAGSSALFELGLALAPETAPLRLNLALEGAAGTRRSIGGRVHLVYEF